MCYPAGLATPAGGYLNSHPSPHLELLSIKGSGHDFRLALAPSYVLVHPEIYWLSEKVNSVTRFSGGYPALRPSRITRYKRGGGHPWSP